MTNYSYLIRPNASAANGQFHGYKTRLHAVRLIVIHTGETAADEIGNDNSAENLSSFMSHTPVRVSWHGTTDSDSVIHELPHGFTGFHVSGYNSSSIGIEQGIYARDWKNISTTHSDAMIDNLALLVAWYCQIYEIPVIWLPVKDAIGGGRGIASHASLNPATRTDPGRDFPLSNFLKRTKFYMDAPIYGIGDGNLYRPELKEKIKATQELLRSNGYGELVGATDGDAGPKFDDAVRKAERDAGLSSTGLYSSLRLFKEAPVEPKTDQGPWPTPNPVPTPVPPTTPNDANCEYDVLATLGGKVVDFDQIIITKN